VTRTPQCTLIVRLGTAAPTLGQPFQSSWVQELDLFWGVLGVFFYLQKAGPLQAPPGSPTQGTQPFLWVALPENFVSPFRTQFSDGCSFVVTGFLKPPPWQRGGANKNPQPQTPAQHPTLFIFRWDPLLAFFPKAGHQGHLLAHPLFGPGFLFTIGIPATKGLPQEPIFLCLRI